MGKATASRETSFTFDDIPLPAAKPFGGSKEETKELYQKLAQVPVGKSFLAEAVVVPPTITDAAERARTFKELANGARNRVTGAISRFKKNDANKAGDFKFETRIIDADSESDAAKHGVRIWRTK